MIHALKVGKNVRALMLSDADDTEDSWRPCSRIFTMANTNRK